VPRKFFIRELCVYEQKKFPGPNAKKKKQTSTNSPEATARAWEMFVETGATNECWLCAKIPAAVFCAICSWLDVSAHATLRCTCVYARREASCVTAHPRTLSVVLDRFEAILPRSLLRLRPRKLVYRPASALPPEPMTCRDKEPEYLSVRHALLLNDKESAFLLQLAHADMATTVQELHVELNDVYSFAALAGFVALRKLHCTFWFMTTECGPMARVLDAMPDLRDFAAPSFLRFEEIVPHAPRLRHLRASGTFAMSERELRSVALCGMPLVTLDVAVDLEDGPIAIMRASFPNLRAASFAWTFPTHISVQESLLAFTRLTALALRTNQPTEAARIISTLRHQLRRLRLADINAGSGSALSTDAVVLAVAGCSSLSELAFTSSALDARQLCALGALQQLRSLALRLADAATLLHLPPFRVLERLDLDTFSRHALTITVQLPSMPHLSSFRYTAYGSVPTESVRIATSLAQHCPRLPLARLTVSEMISSPRTLSVAVA
jgi:hypothetical protein